MDLGTNLLSCLTGILDLEAREPEFKVEAEAEVELEGRPVKGPPGQEYELTDGPVVLEPVLAALLEILLVSVQLLLRVNILKKLSLVPPPIIQKSLIIIHEELLSITMNLFYSFNNLLFVCLNKDGIGFNFLN